MRKVTDEIRNTTYEIRNILSSRYFLEILLTDKPMPDKNKKHRIFISAAEPSADAYCADLITALRKSSYGHDIEFVGVGGPKNGWGRLPKVFKSVIFTLPYPFCREINKIFKDSLPAKSAVFWRNQYKKGLY